MLLKNIFKYKVKSAVEGMPTLDNYFTTKKPKKAKGMKVKKGYYGGVGPYATIGLNADVGGGDGGGDA